MRQTRIWDKILLSGAALICAVGFVGTALFPARRFSARENRYLAAFPEITASGIFAGTVSTELESFADERFLLRAPCRALWSCAMLALGQREAHGVILCSDGSLSRRLPTDEAIFQKNLFALMQLQRSSLPIPFTVAIAPRRIEARREVLPMGYDTASERAEWARLPSGTLTFPDCTADAQWFCTDHHWTAEGAYAAYVQLGEKLGYTPFPQSEYRSETVSKSFLGSSYAAAGLPLIQPDEVKLWHYEGEEDLLVLRDGTPAPFSGLYDRAKLQSSDQYAVFLGGNCGVTEITTGEGDTRPLLLVIKDSFGNSLLPFLSRHFRIVAYDPRYTTLSLSSLSQAQHLLILCGMQTLTQSPFLSLLRQ